MPLALDSFERRCTEGMFFELADGAQSEGYPREHFTSPFGRVFEEFVQRGLERALPALGVPRVYRPHQYRRGGETVDATDAVVDSGDAVIFCEIVAKRPLVATLTRGDLASFESDMEEAVLKKARQLYLNIEAFRSQELVYTHLRFDGYQETWPVLIIVEGFSTMPPIPRVIANALAAKGFLVGAPPLAILDAEEFAQLEGLLAAGFSFAGLLRRWKRDPTMADLPFVNFVDGLDDVRARTARRAEFYEQAWGELTRRITAQTFGHSN